MLMFGRMPHFTICCRLQLDPWHLHASREAQVALASGSFDSLGAGMLAAPLDSSAAEARRDGRLCTVSPACINLFYDVFLHVHSRTCKGCK